MIVVSVLKEKNTITGLVCEGHSGYARHGQDIVCSAVSTLTINAINSIEQILGLKLNPIVNEKQGLLKFELPNDITENQMSIAQILLQSAVIGLKDISANYNKYLAIKEIQK